MVESKYSFSLDTRERREVESVGTLCMRLSIYDLGAWC
jgi:hypothetical protein